MPKKLKIVAVTEVPELYLYGEIAPPSWFLDQSQIISAQSVIDALDQIGNVPELVVRINSPGGDVFEANAIYNALDRFPAKVRVEVDALAASAASIIAMAGDEIVMAGNALMMIHRAWSYVAGNAEDMQRTAETLNKVDETIVDTYLKRAGGKSTREQIQSWMSAETWMTSAEAVDRGFADRAGELKGVAAAVQPGRFKNTPEELISGSPETPDRLRYTIAARLIQLRSRWRFQAAEKSAIGDG